jgi:hypothetical protein
MTRFVTVVLAGGSLLLFSAAVIATNYCQAATPVGMALRVTEPEFYRVYPEHAMPKELNPNGRPVPHAGSPNFDQLPGVTIP